MRTFVRLLVPILAIMTLAALPALAHQCSSNASASGRASYYQSPAAAQPLPQAQVAPVAVDLRPFLQAEVNEVATLTAQSNDLRQRGETVSADLLASYIPDHQMQVARLQRWLGRTPDVMSLQPNESPFLGSAADVIARDRDAHVAAMDLYRGLLQQTVGLPYLHQVALLGLNGASRHFDSLTVAESTLSPSSLALNAGPMAALSLERGAVVDLEVQAEQLQAVGDFAQANLLLSQVSAHQQQIASLSGLVLQNGGDPVWAVPALVPPMRSPGAIQTALRISDRQLAQTYAVPIALAPQSPLAQLALNGQQIALRELAAIGPTIPTA